MFEEHYILVCGTFNCTPTPQRLPDPQKTALSFGPNALSFRPLTLFSGTNALDIRPNAYFTGMMCRTLTLICLLLSLSQPLFSQSEMAALVRTITVEDGLPQGWVTSMVQDRQGFIWIASKGLSRYDGRSFIHYWHSNADTGSLSGNQIRLLYADDHNNLWVYFIDTTAIDLVNTLTGRVRHISAEPAFAWLHHWYGAQVVQQGGQYFCGRPEKLVAFDMATGRQQPIRLPAGEVILASGNMKDKPLFSTNKALYAVNRGQLKRLVTFPYLPVSTDSVSKLIGVHWFAFARLDWDRNGNLLCPGAGGFFVCYAASGTAQYFPFPTSLFYDSFLKQTGGTIFSISNGKLIRISNDYRLLPVQVAAVKWVNNPSLIDHSGLLWVAAGNGNGIRVINVQPNNFHATPNVSGFSHDLLLPWLNNPIPDLDGSSYMLRWAKDTGGYIWVSCPGIHFANQQTNLHNYIFRLNQNTITPVDFKDAEPHYFTFSNSGQCWAVMEQQPKRWLAKANLQKGSYQRVVALPDDPGLFNGYITTIANTVCVVIEDSLLLYDMATIHCTRYTKQQLGISASMLMALPDPQHNNLLWIATQGSGIVLLNIATGKTKHFTPANGLPDSIVYSMMADRHGYFWCSSNKGIFRFNPKHGSTISFTVKDGLPGNEFNRYHFMEMPDGRFAFGGPAGYTLFHPDSIFIDYFQPPTIISDIQINNQPLSAINTHFKDTVISSLQRIELPYDQNFLTIRFAGLQYENPGKIQYRYKMEELDQDWILSGTEAIARYTAMNTGHYTFLANTANTSGMWSKQVKKLEITILPQWWKTGWSYLLYTFIVTGIGYALYRNWLQRAKAKQQIILQQQETEQLKAVDEMKSRFFSNITHEFRTPLSLIIGPAGKMLQQEPAAEWKKNIQVIDRNARQMLLLINQLLDMAKLEAGNIKISLRRGNIYPFVQDEMRAFEATAAAKNIHLQLTATDNQEENLFDAEKLHAILSNLISNAVKFTPSGGTIAIEVNALEEEKIVLFSFQVKDSGIGITPEKLPFIFNRFYQVEDNTTRNYEGTGIGLALAKELAELMGGTLTVKSEPGKGTCFMLQLVFAKAFDENVAKYQPVQQQRSILDNKIRLSYQVNETKPLILVVEDNEELREFITQIFSKDYRVLSAANGEEGLRIANEELPDVIISDLMMPGMDGRDFCTAIKTNIATNHIAFILLTAKASPVSVIENLQNKADDYLTKPFIVEELQLRVKNMIERQESVRQHFRQQLAFIHLDNRTISKTEVFPPLSNPFLEELYTVIEKKLDDSEFSVDKLATGVAMSKRTLTRKLSSMANVSPAELIKSVRLKKAAELLQSGMGVAETTYRVGYESPASFSTLFKEAYGVPPSEYKTQASG